MLVPKTDTDTMDFNPLRREGGDNAKDWHLISPDDFNPLRREGGDRLSLGVRKVSWNFNPLRREGGDGGVDYIESADAVISIHSAARAETVDNKDRVYDVEFQSTPPRGRRRECTDYDCRLRGNFNPLRREGGDNAS